jgi:hypothetical protein
MKKIILSIGILLQIAALTGCDKSGSHGLDYHVTCTIDNTMRNADFTGGTFKGTYSPIVWDTENKSILFVGTNNTLYWPTAGGHVNACRAYFDLGTYEAREFVMNFDGENEVTSLPQPLQKEGSQADAWYTLDGRKLNGKPTTKGLYIHNGKKVIIK